MSAIQTAKLGLGLKTKDITVPGSHNIEGGLALSNANLGLLLDVRDHTDPGEHNRDPEGIEGVGQDAGPG